MTAYRLKERLHFRAKKVDRSASAYFSGGAWRGLRTIGRLCVS
jgi:hypothetical protein